VRKQLAEALGNYDQLVVVLRELRPSSRNMSPGGLTVAVPRQIPGQRRFDELSLQHADTRPGVGLRDGLPDLLWRRRTA
jgi:hypothetical protein